MKKVINVFKINFILEVITAKLTPIMIHLIAMNQM